MGAFFLIINILVYQGEKIKETGQVEKNLPFIFMLVLSSKMPDFDLTIKS